MHSGKALAGIASPNLTYGRRSKYLLGGLAERIEEAERDPHLLALREEIAVVRALISSSLEKLDTGETSEVWRELIKLRTDVKKAQAAQDTEKVWKHAAVFVALIEHAESVEAVPEDLFRAVETVRKLIESEARRIEKMHLMLRYEDLALFVRRVLTCVRVHVSDRRALEAISRDLSSLLRDVRK